MSNLIIRDRLEQVICSVLIGGRISCRPNPEPSPLDHLAWRWSPNLWVLLFRLIEMECSALWDERLLLSDGGPESHLQQLSRLLSWLTPCHLGRKFVEDEAELRQRVTIRTCKRKTQTDHHPWKVWKCKCKGSKGGLCCKDGNQHSLWDLNDSPFEVDSRQPHLLRQPQVFPRSV